MEITEREKVIKGLECCTQHGSMSGRNCNGHWGYTDASHTSMELIGEYRAGCTYGNCETGCVKTLAKDAIALLKALEPAVAYWIPCNGKSHIWYCSECGEKINYNDARRTYKTEKKPVEAVNRYCRGCGATMVHRPTDEQREATPWG